MMVIDPLDSEIRELCLRLAAADGPELAEVAKQLRAALRRQADQARLLSLKMANAGTPKKSNAAD